MTDTPIPNPPLTLCNRFTGVLCEYLRVRHSTGPVGLQLMTFQSETNPTTFMVYKASPEDNGLAIEFCPFCGGSLLGDKNQPDFGIAPLHREGEPTPWACDEPGCTRTGTKADGPEGWCEEHWPTDA